MKKKYEQPTIEIVKFEGVIKLDSSSNDVNVEEWFTEQEE